MKFRDYYQIMNVGRDATQDEIKRSYRKLARKYHPDVSDSSDAEIRFKELGEAYAVLRDPEKRAAYDELGENWQAGQDFRPPPGWAQNSAHRGGHMGGASAEQFSDFFESLFGRGGFSQGPHATAGQRTPHVTGADTRTTIAIDLEDSYRGTKRAITLKHTEVSKDGRPRVKERTLNVQIPKGIRAGQQIRLARQGSPGGGHGQPGDLYLEIEFRAHALFRVEGKDVYLDFPIAPWEAALGAAVKVPTPTGAVDMKVPAGSQSGRKLRLKGRGLPGAAAGDLFVVLRIATPAADSDSEKDAYRQFAAGFDFDPRAGMEV